MRRFPVLLSALILLAVTPAIAGWPRTIESDAATILIYQPQVESLEGNVLTSRAAVSIKTPDNEEPIFGAVWIAARGSVDRDVREIYIEDVKVPRVRFPNSTPAQEARLAALIEGSVPEGDLTISLDRALVMLENARDEQAAAANLDNSPPRILYSQEAAMLVTIDGEPHLVATDDSKLMRVVNCPFLILYDTAGKGYYLYAGEDAWYTASDLTGEWTFTGKVPKSVAKQAPDTSDIEVPEAPEGQQDSIPKIYVSTEPAELISIRGKPEFSLVTGTDLMYVDNTDNDVLLLIETQQYFVLLSGRWYTASSLEGPWTFVAADALPEDFRQIPDESEVSDVRVSVAGTEEAREAVMDAQIPQTAKVDRKQATLEVTYDGEPRFEKITGTDLEYAVNTATPVLKEGGKYYACSDAVWFVADAPRGPWAVSTERPEDVEKIPPENPYYNVKYVYIYDSTPEVVYVGYTPGYTCSYVHHTTVVYGTGYYYPGWYGSAYYPRVSTWGLGVRYNPWSGWSFGLTYSNGWFTFGVGFGGWYPWRGGIWGPGAYHGYWRGYRRGYYSTLR